LPGGEFCAVGMNRPYCSGVRDSSRGQKSRFCHESWCTAKRRTVRNNKLCFVCAWWCGFGSWIKEHFWMHLNLT